MTVERVRAAALALPEVVEEAAWTGVRWRVRGRTFAHVLQVERGWPLAYSRASGTDGPATLLMVRGASPEVDHLRAGDPPFFPVPWRSDEVGALLDDLDPAEMDELVQDSWAAMAPARLLAAWRAEQGT